MKRAAFYAIMLFPLAALVSGIIYIAWFTNVPPLLYLYSIRHIPFDCMDFGSETYVYKMKPGECRSSNIEYDTVMTHDMDGFRNNPPKSHYDFVAIGDSHTEGWGVADDATFASLLESKFHYATRNLGIGSYATLRELEVLARYGNGAKYVLIQYCDNDFGENLAALKLGKEEFRAQVEAVWRDHISVYNQGKSRGWRKPVHDLAVMLVNGSYSSLSAWRRSGEARGMEQEALAFAGIIARYRDALDGKRLIVFELAGHGHNSTRFASTFGAELRKIEWLRFKIVSSTAIVGFSDYYFLDGHLNPTGHHKMAAALASEIAAWESESQAIVH
jgi:lysophospholipase L1-like esterase